MLQSNHSLARPCPSCGAPLRVHSGRMSQKMQCPKCLDTISLDPAAAPEPDARETVKTRTKTPARKPASRMAAAADPELAHRYAELLLEHTELAERYADAVADYDALVATHADLAMRLHQLHGA